METIIIHPQNEVQQKALQVILEGFQISYEYLPDAQQRQMGEPATDETEHILANLVMTKCLNDSIQNAERGIFQL